MPTDTPLLTATEQQALQQVYATMRTDPRFYLPPVDGRKPDTRLDDALLLVQAGRVVWMADTQQWFVQGRAKGYLLGETCPCPDGVHHRVWCYHNIARTLYCAWQRALGQALPAGAPQLPLALPPTTVQERLAQATTVTPDTAPVFSEDPGGSDGGWQGQEEDMRSMWLGQGQEDPASTADAPSVPLAEVLDAALDAALAEVLDVDHRTGEIRPSVLQEQPMQHAMPPVAAQELPRDEKGAPGALLRSAPLPNAILGHSEGKNGQAPFSVGNGLPPLATILARLAQPLPKDCLGTKTQGGVQITFIPHYVVSAVLDAVAPGWQSEIAGFESSQGVVRMFLRLGIPCAEGMAWREDVGESDDWETDPKQYGNPSANAYASGLRRVAARFGLGRWLYDRQGHLAALARHLGTPAPQSEPMRSASAPRATAPVTEDSAIAQQQRDIAQLLIQLRVPTNEKAHAAYIQGVLGLAFAPQHFPAILAGLKTRVAQQGRPA